MGYRAPAYQHYAREWLAETARLSLGEQGAYQRLLDHQWSEGPLPDDEVQLARLLGVGRAQFRRLWKAVAPFFPALDSPQGFRANLAMEEKRCAQEEYRRNQAEHGKKGALKLWGSPRRGQEETNGVAHGSASASTSASASASGSAPAITTSEPTDLDEEPLAAAAPVGVSVARRKGSTHDAVTAHLQDVLAPERRDAFEAMQPAAKRRILAELVFAYWQINRHHEQALYDDQRESILVRALKVNRDNVSELLYVVDGVGKDSWPDRKSHDGIGVLFRDRSQIERFAGLCPDYNAGTAHKTALRYGLASYQPSADAGA